MCSVIALSLAVEQKLRIFMMSNYVSSLSMRSRFPCRR